MHTKKGCRANIRTRDPKTGWCFKNGGQPLEKKELIRAWVEETRLAPERLEVEITYRVPEPVVKEAQPVARAH